MAVRFPSNTSILRPRPIRGKVIVVKNDDREVVTVNGVSIDLPTCLFQDKVFVEIPVQFAVIPPR